MSLYQDFLARKKIQDVDTGIASPPRLNPKLMPYQRAIVRWALKRGRAALFEDCGLGKSFQQLEWARVVAQHTGGDVLILAPLSVASQTVREGKKFGIKVNHCAEQSDVQPGVNITNYEKLHNFDTGSFVGVVLDESSILKAFTGKIRNFIINSFATTPYRLACTATPAPNDLMELGNHAQFLGVMSHSTMLSRFFVHDGGETQKWRLKRHAEDLFWEWVSSWACLVRKPSDLGFEDGGFVLPPLQVHSHLVGPKMDVVTMTLTERRDARRETLADRVRFCANMVNKDTEQWLIWCDLNAESEALTTAINGAVEIKGSDKSDHKERAMSDFISGEARVLVTKPSIAGFGMNLQNCHQMVFVGLSDSFEQMYQAIRRCYRFGQQHPVDCHIVTSTREGPVLQNIRRKEADAQMMSDRLASHSKRVLSSNIQQSRRERDDYQESA